MTPAHPHPLSAPLHAHARGSEGTRDERSALVQSCPDSAGSGPAPPASLDRQSEPGVSQLPSHFARTPRNDGVAHLLTKQERTRWTM